MYAPRLQRRWCINNVEQIPGKVRKRDGVVGLRSHKLLLVGNRIIAAECNRARRCVYANMQGRGDVTSGVSFFAVLTYHAGERGERPRGERESARESPLYAHATVSPRLIRVRKYTHRAYVTWNIRTRASIFSILRFLFLPLLIE